MIGSNWRARNARIASALTPARRASTLRGDFEQPRFEFADRVNRGPAKRRACDERPQCFEVGDIPDPRQSSDRPAQDGFQIAMLEISGLQLGKPKALPEYGGYFVVKIDFER